MWMASRVGGRDYPASDVASKIAFNRLRRSTLVTFLLMPYWFVLVLGFFRSARLCWLRFAGAKAAFSGASL
jgi:hypothetical protein